MKQFWSFLALSIACTLYKYGDHIFIFWWVMVRKKHIHNLWPDNLTNHIWFYLAQNITCTFCNTNSVSRFPHYLLMNYGSDSDTCKTSRLKVYLNLNMWQKVANIQHANTAKSFKCHLYFVMSYCLTTETLKTSDWMSSWNDLCYFCHRKSQAYSTTCAKVLTSHL